MDSIHLILSNLHEVKNSLKLQKRQAKDNANDFKQKARELFINLLTEIDNNTNLQIDAIEEKKNAINNEIDALESQLKRINDFGSLSRYEEEKRVKIQQVFNFDEDITIQFEDCSVEIECGYLLKIPFLADLATETMQNNKFYVFHSGKYFKYVILYCETEHLDIPEEIFQEVIDDFDFFGIDLKTIPCFVKQTQVESLNSSIHDYLKCLNIQCVDNTITSMNKNKGALIIEKDVFKFECKIVKKPKFLSGSGLAIGYSPKRESIPIIGKDGIFLLGNGGIASGVLGKNTLSYIDCNLVEGSKIKIKLDVLERKITYNVNGLSSTFSLVDITEELFPTIIVADDSQVIEVTRLWTLKR
ncbi:Uncharacterized protein QTN25_002959 [Entamoeba marina]